MTSLLVGGVLLIAPPVAWQHSLPEPSAGDVGVTTSFDGSATSADVAARPQATSSQGPSVPESVPDPGAPTRLRAPSIDLDAPLDPVGLEDDGAMELPDDVRRVGWYEPGVRPGQAGSAVLAGHVDSRTQGEGALFDLRRLDPGDEITTTDQDGWSWTWEVTARSTHARDELPIAELFRWEGPTELRIITCGGTFDAARGGYSHNVVVHAVLRGEPRPPTSATAGDPLASPR